LTSSRGIQKSPDKKSGHGGSTAERPRLYLRETRREAAFEHNASVKEFRHGGRRSQYFERRIMSDYKVWDCKIVVPIDTEMPDGFDNPPRRAAVKAVEAIGIKVVACFSGWGGELTKTELKIVEK